MPDVDFEVSHELLLKVLAHSKKARKIVRVELGRHIDPPDCGCTDCAVGRTRPARNRAEYALSQAARGERLPWTS